MVMPAKPMTDARRNAYALYLTGTMRDTKIAESVKVSPKTLEGWIANDGWRQDRKNLAEEEMEIVRGQMREIISRHRIGHAIQELKITSKIKDEIEFAIDHQKGKGVPLHAGTLRDYAIALKTASEVNSRITGFTEQAVAIAAGEQGDQAAGISVNFTVTGAVMPELAKPREKIHDISDTVEVIPPGLRASTPVSVAQVCPF